MFSHIEQLKTALLAFSETHSKASKAKKIRHLYSTLEHVINEGLSIDLIVDFLNQHDIPITKNNLKVTLYRIRKEKGLVKNKGRDYLIENNSLIHSNKDVTNHNESFVKYETLPTPIIRNSIEEQKIEYQTIKKNYAEAKGWHEKYAALGGDINDLKNISPSEQRQACVVLRMNFSKKYSNEVKGI